MTAEEMDRGFQEIWGLFKELREDLQETDRMFRESREESEKRSKETERRMEESDRRLKEEVEKMTRSVDAAITKVDSLTGKWSRFVEGLIAPAAIRLFRERGIEVNGISQRAKRFSNGSSIEVDILAVNGEYAVLIEAKSTLKIEDVNDHIERLKRFKSFFPEYADRKAIGAVGGIVIDEESDKYAYRNGLFVIAESGDTVKILNDSKFKPKIW